MRNRVDRGDRASTKVAVAFAFVHRCTINLDCCRGGKLMGSSALWGGREDHGHSESRVMTLSNHDLGGNGHILISARVIRRRFRVLLPRPHLSVHAGLSRVVGLRSGRGNSFVIGVLNRHWRRHFIIPYLLQRKHRELRLGL